MEKKGKQNSKCTDFDDLDKFNTEFNTEPIEIQTLTSEYRSCDRDL